ncbi:MAG: DNA-binding protein [Acidobacteriaceae bacterium]|nr:DNA-binding protein [Acidobacteriaceae bacterium]MBV9502701.1 DNA-binding protein [Acidobacteriaceae bacterium]
MARLLLAPALILAATNLHAQTSAPEIFGPDQITDVYRVSLDRGASLLESINDVIRSKGIRDGHVIISAGSVQECTYHFVASTDLKAQNEYRTVSGPSEILGGGGIIADGEPHVHIALSNPEKGVYGGHLEKGCRVLYLAEFTVFRFRGGAPLTRKSNQNGTLLLQKK